MNPYNHRLTLTLFGDFDQHVKIKKEIVESCDESFDSRLALFGDFDHHVNIKKQNCRIM